LPQPAEANCPTAADLSDSLKPLADVSLGIGTEGLVPADCHAAQEELAEAGDLYSPRTHTGSMFHWQASRLGHNPLYFEDVPLERHGHSVHPCLQPALSGARFFGNVPILPYRMGLDHPCEYDYTLGHRRPGSCAEHLRERLPWDWKAAAIEAGAVTGFVFFFP